MYELHNFFFFLNNFLIVENYCDCAIPVEKYVALSCLLKNRKKYLKSNLNNVCFENI